MNGTGDSAPILMWDRSKFLIPSGRSLRNICGPGGSVSVGPRGSRGGRGGGGGGDRGGAERGDREIEWRGRMGRIIGGGVGGRTGGGISAARDTWGGSWDPPVDRISGRPHSALGGAFLRGAGLNGRGAALRSRLVGSWMAIRIGGRSGSHSIRRITSHDGEDGGQGMPREAAV